MGDRTDGWLVGRRSTNFLRILLLCCVVTVERVQRRLAVFARVCSVAVENKSKQIFFFAPKEGGIFRSVLSGGDAVTRATRLPTQSINFQGDC